MYCWAVTKMQPFIPAAVFLLCFILGNWDKLAAASDDNDFGVDKLLVSSLFHSGEFRAHSASHSNNFKLKYEKEGDGNATSRHYYIFHGWKGNKNEKWITDAAAGILKLKDNNVLRLDWRSVAAMDYPNAVINVERIAKQLAKHLVREHKSGKLDLNKLTLIGHDLAAHIIGIAGKIVFKELGKKVGKIVAPSPAGPHYHLASSNKKLQKDDAQCVVVIHTDRLLFGYKFPIGGLEFSANGGFYQPGCKTAYSDCSYKRAGSYLGEAYQKIRYEAVAPRSSGPNEGLKKLIHILGDDCTRGQGAYNFTTNSKPPYLPSL